jgi:hypothetical protein
MVIYGELKMTWKQMTMVLEKLSVCRRLGVEVRISNLIGYAYADILFGMS